MNIIIHTEYGVLKGTIITAGFYNILLRVSDNETKQLIKLSCFFSRHDGDDLIVDIPIKSEQNQYGKAPKFYLI